MVSIIDNNDYDPIVNIYRDLIASLSKSRSINKINISFKIKVKKKLIYILNCAINSKSKEFKSEI